MSAAAMPQWRGRMPLGALAAAAWALSCVAWFDVAAPLRPAPLNAVPAAVHGLLALGLVAAWGVSVCRRVGATTPGQGDRRGLLLVVLAAAAFRLPLAFQGSAGYLTPDGALSGIVALHLGDGSEHLVFVPQVAYSGSLKSHLAALLALAIDPSRAFALASIFFYVLFAAAVHRLGRLARPDRPWVAVAAGLYVAFAPAFVTRYSLSNDGNYVEVMGLGAWALVLAVLFCQRPPARAACAWAMGVLLGLAFWSHVLALFAVLTVAVALVVLAPRAAPAGLVRVAGGFALGWLPALLWNAANGWETVQYLLPGGAPGSDEAAGLGVRAAGLVRDHALVLLGYDPGNPPLLDALLRAGALAACVGAVIALARGIREAVAVLRLSPEERTAQPAVLVLVLFVLVNVGVAVLALPYLPGNPRYVLFAFGPLAVLLALACEGRDWSRGAFTALVVFSALGALAQAPGAFRADASWRGFVADLQAAGVRHCYTDFFLATKINFLSGERVVCSAKLGPTTTEYFTAYREEVDRAPAAALVAVNGANADKLERRLQRLGVGYVRRELMKPVLSDLSRKVDPAEIFPDREFPLR